MSIGVAPWAVSHRVAYACCPECELPYGIQTHVTPFDDADAQHMWSQRYEAAVAPLMVMAEYCCPPRWYRACFNNNVDHPMMFECGGASWGGEIIVAMDPNFGTKVDNHLASWHSEPSGLPDGECQEEEDGLRNGMWPTCFADTDHKIIVAAKASNAGYIGDCEHAQLKTIRLWVPNTDPHIWAQDYDSTSEDCPTEFTHRWVNTAGVFLYESQLTGQNTTLPEHVEPSYCGRAQVCVKARVEAIGSGSPTPSALPATATPFTATPGAGTPWPSPTGGTPAGGYTITATPSPTP